MASESLEKLEEVSIIESIVGILAFNRKNDLIEKSLFPPKPEEIADRLLQLEAGNVTEELDGMLKSLSQKGFRNFVFENRALARNLESDARLSIEFKGTTQAGDFLRTRLEEVIFGISEFKTAQQLHALTHDVAKILAKRKLSREFEQLDPLIIQAVHAVEELDNTINVLSTKTRDWYSIHFPELNRLAEDHETYMKLIVEIGDKSNFRAEALQRINLPKSLSDRIIASASGTMGVALGSEDLEAIRRLSTQILALYDLRKAIGDYVASLTEIEAPNCAAVIGPLLTAKLISRAGGLRKLALMPSSKIQVLGAEKAMFRALKTGARPPKHGIIFQHPLVHTAPRRQRGKTARILAAKLSLASRVDVYSRRFIGDKLKEDLEKRIRELKP